MSYLKFDKNQLTNLEFSLKREFIRTNRSGAYGSTTIINCNTRKYHGLLVCPVEELNNERYVLLSMVDPTIVYDGYEFNLGIRKYSGGFYEPKGHKYIEELSTDVLPTLSYNIGGIKIDVDQVLDHEDFRVLIKYTVTEIPRYSTKSPNTITFRLKPFLAFRNIHELSKANFDANIRPEMIENGIRIRMYDSFPYLNMQFNKKIDFVHLPDWYYNVEYPMEQERGYDFKEDLFTPGFFETTLKKGESIFFAAGTEVLPVNNIRRRFTTIQNNRIPRYNFENCLYNAAQQFIEKRKKSTYLISGYHWYDARSRDTFIAAPGLTLSLGNPQTLINVLDTALRKYNNGTFPQLLNKKTEGTCPSADTPLWFIYAVQQLQEWVTPQFVVIKYWETIKSILNHYYDGLECGIKMTDHCLIYLSHDHYPQTWMDAVVNGKPVTPRRGFSVEVNALWYNALMYA
ncbi:MAG TPA: glycogen debranching enzyme N-terminal domain-containing protein [Salinivirgaceae bacterium]|nr:glycogen debranching enzyme N-terminal domain-containing protein [Salinivirgaceae bacterium]